FSSRRRHTRLQGDWSSDVCSSDLVILNRKFGSRAREVDPGNLDELTFLLESGSDRIGALDFQASPSAYVAREGAGASLEELLNEIGRASCRERGEWMVVGEYARQK